MNTDTMKILYKEPGKEPEVREIANDLLTIQTLVGGYIETVTLDDIVLICNEDGKLLGMDPNLYVEQIDDVICGPVVFCRVKNYDFADIGDNDVKWIRRRLGWF